MPHGLRRIRPEDLQYLNCIRLPAVCIIKLPSWGLSHRTRTSSKGRYCGEISTCTSISNRYTCSSSYSYYFSLVLQRDRAIILLGLPSKMAGHRPGHHFLTLHVAGNVPGRGYSPAGWKDSLQATTDFLRTHVAEYNRLGAKKQIRSPHAPIENSAEMWRLRVESETYTRPPELIRSPGPASL